MLSRAQGKQDKLKVRVRTGSQDRPCFCFFEREDNVP